MPVIKSVEKRASVKCVECLGDITELQTILKCDVCQKNYHPKCVGVLGQHLTRATNANEWTCKSCKPNALYSNVEVDVNKRKPNSPPNTLNSPKRLHLESFGPGSSNAPVSFAQFEKMFDFIKNSHTEVMSKVNNVMSTVSDVKENQLFLSQQIDTINSQLNKLNDEQLHVRKDVNILNEQYLQHSTQISKLEAEVDAFNQRMLQNNVIIAGLPHNVDPKEVLNNMMTKLNTNCTVADVYNAEFIKTKTPKSTGNTDTNLMLVKFNTYEAKMDFITKKKEKQSLLCSEISLNTSSDKQVYVRDHLTSFKINIFKQAREFKEKYNYKYLWLKNSNIFLRKSDHSKVYTIKTQLDMDNLIVSRNMNSSISNQSPN